MSRVDQYNVTVALEPTGPLPGKDLGTWDQTSGGNVDSSELKYSPGGMAPEISLGGKISVQNVTVTRLFDLDRDGALLPVLLGAVGKQNATITKQPLDVDGNAHGKPLVYHGKLKNVNPPDANSEGNAAALIALEISAASAIAA